MPQLRGIIIIITIITMIIIITIIIVIVIIIGSVPHCYDSMSCAIRRLQDVLSGLSDYAQRHTLILSYVDVVVGSAHESMPQLY